MYTYTHTQTYPASGNLHQSQYCEKIKSILEFVGQKLSMEELTTMWEMQVDKNPVQVRILAHNPGYCLDTSLESWYTIFFPLD